ncbi:sensor histidine kinase [Anaerosacchariphilus polymeriproducens]|uniref:histidine kinase n=1 Tax=Anaerosacchariphilus polymeriproducens TaxID=1812858 RepID=A0A371AT60_9FIRM|nr:HAMP domain-containing sensor histidine kinase [Anaerosacchariphilus polymeriproducens]RDU22650.1 sensor histidine kinase [Anaerosacchariphilus polymeriproducens]
MKNKILMKLVAAFAVVMLLFSIVLGSVFLILFRNHTITINRTTMEQKAVSIASTLSSFQEGNRGYGAYLRFLDELAMAEVWIVDEHLNISVHGHGMHSANYQKLPENAEEIVSRVFSGELTYGEEFSDLLGTNALTVGAPILDGERVIGAVLLHSPISGINAAVEQGILALIIGIGVALIFAGIAAALLSYRFTRPLAQMKTTALELADGNYVAQTGVCQQDEIGQLASVLDTLALRLQSAEAEQEKLNRLRENFVANVSHELRTPVAVLRGSLELLQDGTVNKPEEISDYYDQMLSESNHLERLVNDLLDLSRLQDEGFHLTISEVNLCDVVQDATRAIRRTALIKNITVAVEVPDTECLVMGDYDRIRQLLLILLDNAVKFSVEQGLIQVNLTKKDGFVLTVTDHGIGISPEDIPYIFDRFHKTHAKENKNGTGLGLAIANEIAKRHKASIHVESNETETTFYLFLPETAPLIK